MSTWRGNGGKEDAVPPVLITAETAIETGLLDEVLNYELLRKTEVAILATKAASGARLMDYLSGWQAEYPGRAFDLAGTEDKQGQVLRLRVSQTAPRVTVDPMLVRQALFEAGVDPEVIDAAMEKATKTGEPGALHPTVLRVRGQGAVAL